MDEIFEIADFTLATDFERFAEDLDESVQKVVTRVDYDQRPILTAEQISQAQEIHKREALKFSKTKVFVDFHDIVTDDKTETKERTKVSDKSETNEAIPLPLRELMAAESDFPSKSHCLVRFFGVTRFILLETEERVLNEDKLNLLLSSSCMSLNHSKHSLPIFCCVDGNRKIFCGLFTRESSRTEFKTIHLNSSPKSLATLSSSLRLFREKVPNHEPIRASIRMTYSLSTFRNRLPKDPLDQLQLGCEWRSLSEDVVIDSDTYTDLEPNRAQKWKLRALFSRQDMGCILRRLFQKFLQISNSRREIVAPSMMSADDDFRAVLNRLSETTNLNQGKKHIVKKIFADCLAVFNNPDIPKTTHRSSKLKSAPKLSLVWKLAEELLKCRSESEFCLLWIEFVAELRRMWEKRLTLPMSGNPDFQFGLLHQKLQLLAKCIGKERKISEESAMEQTTTITQEVEDEEMKDANDNDDDNEFFDAEEDITEPEGRLKETNMRLIDRPNAMLWIPETQDLPPMTEDQLADQQAVLAQIGQSEQAQSIRAKIQSAGLLSDMEAFKAANPGASFEDFVRWHSPRDYDTEKQTLSARFQVSGNLWREVWDSATAVPIRKQKKLFDAENEAEKILHFLDKVTVHDVANLVKSVIVDLLRDHLWKKLHNTYEVLDDRIFDDEDDDAIIRHLTEKEVMALRFESLVAKFLSANKKDDYPEKFMQRQTLIRELSRDLLWKTEVEIPVSGDALLARLVRNLFREAKEMSREETPVGDREPTSGQSSEFPEAVFKELVLRTRAALPERWSRVWPQRMYFSFSRNELRICSAITRDTLFT